MLWGSGGEAEVYDIGGVVLKVFKAPDHPDHLRPEDREAAKRRIDEHQRKLVQFPQNLPARVVVPRELARDASGKIVGYTMQFLENAEPLMRYSEKSFRLAGVSNEVVIQVFRDLHATVADVHKCNTVLGDFNDLNVLIENAIAYLIDADSFQFGSFLCKVYTTNFVDPLLCDPKEKRPMLNQPHNINSDWYAFTVMLMRSLLFVGPYGGVYRPKDPKKRVPEPARPLHRVSVFNPEVRYPRPAVHYRVLPDDMLQVLHEMFDKDRRGEFPLAILESIRWTKCTKCGTEHARGVCPECAEAAPAAIKETVTIRGKVTARRIFKTSGVIVFATIQNDKLLWLYNENSTYKREDGSPVAYNPADPQIRYRIRGKLTYLGKHRQVMEFSGETMHGRRSVGRFGTLPVFDANSNHFYWLEQGRLLRDDEVGILMGSEYIGDVLMNQTLFWVGETFGFGFYHAGRLNVAFIFDAEKRGINDTVKVPPIRGQLMDSTCVFASKRCWFLTATEEGSRRVNRCFVINRNGTVEAQAEADQGDGSWLGTLRGKLAAGNFLLAATDDGIVRVETQGGSIVETQKFPDTAPFVDTECHIFPSKGGIYVVSSREVSILQIS